MRVYEYVDKNSKNIVAQSAAKVAGGFAKAARKGKSKIVVCDSGEYCPKRSGHCWAWNPKEKRKAA